MPELESCVLFSTADWDAPYWTNKQHTAALMGKRGIQVLYIESVGLRAPNASSGKDWTRLGKRLVAGLRSLLQGPKNVQPNVWVLSPLVIPFKHANFWIRWFNQNLLKLQVKRFLGSRELKKPLIWTYHPFMLDALNWMNVGKLVYHCVDDLSAIPGIDTTAFNAEEYRLLKKADVVFATAQALAENCAQHNHNTYFLSNVVDVDHFSKAFLPNAIPDDLSHIPEPRLAYHGVLSDFKINFQLLLDVARLKPEWSFVFIGEEREGQKNKQLHELLGLSNVYFLGYKEYEILPEYLRGMHVGLLPTLINEYTNSMFPMKYYEYIASGLPVVSTSLLFAAFEKHRLMIGNSAIEFVKAIEEQLTLGKFKISEARKIVGVNTWDDRMLKMMELIK